MKKITIKTLPSSIDEFVQLRDQIAKTPEGGAAILLLALKIFADNEQLGKQCLVVASDRSRLQEGDDYKGYSIVHSDMNLLSSQLSKYPNIPNSYIEGASPENNYSVTLPFVYTFSRQKYSGDESEGVIKIFVKCYGADIDRPIQLTRNNRGLWKATNWSSIIVGIKKPPIDDDI